MLPPFYLLPPLVTAALRTVKYFYTFKIYLVQWQEAIFFCSLKLLFLKNTEICFRCASIGPNQYVFSVFRLL